MSDRDGRHASYNILHATPGAQGGKKTLYTVYVEEGKGEEGRVDWEGEGKEVYFFKADPTQGKATRSTHAR